MDKKPTNNRLILLVALANLLYHTFANFERKKPLLKGAVVELANDVLLKHQSIDSVVDILATAIKQLN